MENVISLGKLIGLLLLFSLPLLLISINVHTKYKTEFARLVMGTIFLVDSKGLKK